MLRNTNVIEKMYFGHLIRSLLRGLKFLCLLQIIFVALLPPIAWLALGSVLPSEAAKHDVSVQCKYGMDFLKLNYAFDSAERSNLWVLLYTTPCSAHFYVGRNCPHNPNVPLSTSLIVTIRDRYAFEQTGMNFKVFAETS